MPRKIRLSQTSHYEHNKIRRVRNDRGLLGREHRMDIEIQVPPNVVDNNDLIEDLILPPIPEIDVPRRIRHPAVPHRVTYKLAIGINDRVEDEVNTHTMGGMEMQCPHCGAYFFQSEIPDRGNVNAIYRCCKGGEIVLERFRECPLELRQLYIDNRGFVENIRYFNSIFAMASFKTSQPQRQNVGQGNWCFGITGQIYHYAADIPLNTPSQPKHNQYYFIDADDAIMHRSALAAERNIPRNLIGILEQILRQSNPYIHAYMSMREVIREMRAIGRDVQNIVIGFKRNINQELRTHNLPDSRSDIAAVFEGEDPPFNVDLKVYPRRENEGHYNELKNLNCLADPMVYPLLFPLGEEGYRTRVPYRTKPNKTVTFREFYRFHLQKRDGFSTIHNGGKLFQQYLVDGWVRTEANQLWWLRQNNVQRRLLPANKAAEYVAQRAAQQQMRVGKIYVLPTSFAGGPRNINRLYLDAMAVVSRHGKPDIFVTFTCNPEWPEIRDNLQYQQTYQHRPDLVCRVFYQKLNEFIDDFNEKQVYGVCLSYIYTIEIQKRGLPHAHILITFRPEDKPETIEEVDALITAEVPDLNTEPLLFAIISRCHIHRLCGDMKPNAPCMIDGKCSKGYPKRYLQHTILRDVRHSGRTLYKRPVDGPRIIVRGHEVYDTSRIIPYNRYAAKKFNAHINFEMCGSLKTIKYLHKYITKGSDRIMIQSREEGDFVNWDEITAYTDCRYVSATEAFWRLFELPMHGRSHSVIALPVHLQGQQTVLIDEAEDEAAVMNAVRKRTKLMAWFDLNRDDVEARQYKYVDIPDHYRWDEKNNGWVRRRQKSKQVGCIIEVSPDNIELFHLRILLSRIPGATSYDDLRRLPDGTEALDFQTACRQLNFLENADEYDLCLAEAVSKRHPKRLRRLFSLICLLLLDFNRPIISTLWEKYWQSMIEDYFTERSERNNRVGRRLALAEILKKIRCSKPELSLADLNIDENMFLVGADREIDGGVVNSPVPENFDLENVVLNTGQLQVVQQVLAAIGRSDDELGQPIHSFTGTQFENHILNMVRQREGIPEGNVLYVDGSGGTGKTFLYNYLLQVVVKVLRKAVRAVAWTGIAATLLYQGRTVHGAFKLPLNLTRETVGGPVLHSILAEELRAVSLVVWDEAAMSPWMAVSAVDKYFRDLMRRPNVPFGGKVFLFGGDFRQILPIVDGGNRMTVINSTLRVSPLWKNMAKFKLSANMRCVQGGDIETYAEFLLYLGEGRHRIQRPTSAPFAPDDLVCLPQQCVVKQPNLLYHFVYGENDVDIADKCILCPTNIMVKLVNDKILGAMEGNVRTYYSVDTLLAPEGNKFHVPEEVLNTIEYASLPPHQLNLKIGAVVVLLRNLSLENGQCNGIRLKVLQMTDHLLDVIIITGKKRGYRFWLPKVRMKAKGDILPNEICRIQFPVKLAYAMTIHKAQGQTFQKVGIYLDKPCFAHGQLYVAFSRVGSFDRVKVYVENSSKQGNFRTHKTFTRNVVYREVLDNVEFPIIERIQPEEGQREITQINPNISQAIGGLRKQPANQIEDSPIAENAADKYTITKGKSPESRHPDIMDSRILNVWNVENRINRVSVGEKAGTSRIHHSPPPRPVFSDDSDSD